MAAEEFYGKMGLKGPCQGDMDKSELKDAVRNALYTSKICSYAQVRAPASCSIVTPVAHAHARLHASKLQNPLHGHTIKRDRGRESACRA